MECYDPRRSRFPSTSHCEGRPAWLRFKLVLWAKPKLHTWDVDIMIKALLYHMGGNAPSSIFSAPCFPSVFRSPHKSWCVRRRGRWSSKEDWQTIWGPHKRYPKTLSQISKWFPWCTQSTMHGGCHLHLFCGTVPCNYFWGTSGWVICSMQWSQSVHLNVFSYSSPSNILCLSITPMSHIYPSFAPPPRCVCWTLHLSMFPPQVRRQKVCLGYQNLSLEPAYRE